MRFLHSYYALILIAKSKIYPYLLFNDVVGSLLLPCRPLFPPYKDLFFVTLSPTPRVGLFFMQIAIHFLHGNYVQNHIAEYKNI